MRYYYENILSNENHVAQPNLAKYINLIYYVYYTLYIIWSWFDGTYYIHLVPHRGHNSAQWDKKSRYKLTIG